MSSDEITEIKIDGDRIGIIGLKSTLSGVAETCGTQTDVKICTELLMRPNKRKCLQEAFAQTAK